MIHISSPIKTIGDNVKATLEDGHKIYIKKPRTGYQEIQIWDKENTLVCNRLVFENAKHDWVHIVAGKLTAHFYVNTNLHEMVIPCDIGKMCTVGRLGE
jgi:hypothetical protein